MSAKIWTVLADDGCRSLVEVREDGVVWLRDGLFNDELRILIQQLALRVHQLTRPTKES